MRFAVQHTEMLLLRAMLFPDMPRSADDLAVARAALMEPLRLEATESVREAYAYVVRSTLPIPRSSSEDSECCGPVVALAPPSSVGVTTGACVRPAGSGQ